MFLLSFAVLIVATSAASVCKCENYSLIMPFDPSNLTAVPYYRRLFYSLHKGTPYAVSVVCFATVLCVVSVVQGEPPYDGLYGAGGFAEKEYLFRTSVISKSRALEKDFAETLIKFRRHLVITFRSYLTNRTQRCLVNGSLFKNLFT